MRRGFSAGKHSTGQDPRPPAQASTRRPGAFFGPQAEGGKSEAKASSEANDGHIELLLYGFSPDKLAAIFGS
jgi:hypothetical protein